MAGANLTQVARQTCGRLFEYYAEFLIAGTYHRDATTAEVAFLVEPVPARLVGSVVMPNDEQLFIDAAAMAGLVNPQPGDYLVETESGLRRNVITAHLDLTRTLWTVVARRVF